MENISWLLDIKNKYLQQYVLESGNGQIAYLFGDEADEDSANYFKYYVMEVTESPKLEESIYTYNMYNSKSFFNYIELSNNKKVELLRLIERYQFLQFCVFNYNVYYENIKFYNAIHDIYILRENYLMNV